MTTYEQLHSSLHNLQLKFKSIKKYKSSQSIRLKRQQVCTMKEYEHSTNYVIFDEEENNYCPVVIP